MRTNPEKRVCAVVVNNLGQILPWTCESTMERAEERASREFAGWENLKKLGAKVVQAEITVIDSETMGPKQ